MRTRIGWPLLGIIVLVAGAPAAGEDSPAPFPGCEPNVSSLLSYDDMLDLGQIAVRQVELAHSGADGLTKQVSPEFSFLLKDGDSFMSSGREKGIGAFKLMARTLGSDRYEIAVPFNGPFLPSTCFRQTVTVTFRDAASRYARTVDFVFERDVLVSANGRTEYYREGSLARPSG